MSKSLLSVLLLSFVVLLLVSPADANLGGGSNKKRRRKKKKRRRRRKRSDSSSSSAFNNGKINSQYEDLTAVELLEYLTEVNGPNKGFTIFLELVDLSDLDTDILEDFTLFAPNDKAFCRTAQNDFDYSGECTPRELLEFYSDLLDGLGTLQDTLATIISYHAALGKMTVKDMRQKGSVVTYCECFEIGVKKQTKRITKLYDAGRTYPNIDFQNQNIAVADDGIVHVIKSVLLPPLNCPPGGGNDCLFAPSVAFVCGEYDCKYNSVCDFQAAGFKRSECTNVDDDYQCGSDCSTDRQCESGDFGYGGCPFCVTGKCADKFPPNEFPCGFECTIDEQCKNRANAPSDNACQYCTDGACSWSREHEKLQCGSNCVTDQQCEDGVQGDVGGCPVCTDGVCTAIQPSCPIAVGGTCSNEDKPVSCDDGDGIFCRYNNQCFADLAGFTAAQCQRVGIAECGAFCVSGNDCLSAGDILSACEICTNNVCSKP